MTNKLFFVKYFFRCFIIVGCAAITLNVNGQEVGDSNNLIEIRVASEVELGEKTRISFVINDNSFLYEKDAMPQWNWDYNGYEVIEGPFKSTTNSFYEVNGKTHVKSSVTFSFILLFTKVGVFSLPPMTLNYAGGESITSESVTIRVIPPKVDQTTETKSTTEDLIGDLLVVETTTNKNNITLGDSVECEIRLYTNLTVDNIDYSRPCIRNVYWRECRLTEETTFERVEYQGSTVKSVLLAKYLVVPLQSGKITIEPMAFTISRVTFNSKEDPFEDLFKYLSYNDTIIRSNEVEIQVANGQVPKRIFEIKAPVQHNTVGLVIDKSSSLLARNDSLSPTFMELENLFIKKLKKEKEFVKPSVTVFSRKPYYPTSSEWTNIQYLTPSKENDGSAVFDAILASASRDGALTSEGLPFSILLLTDGADNASRLSESTLINILLRHNIRVDVIAFVSKNKSVYYNFDKLETISIKPNDVSDVERIAKATNGLFVKIEDEKQIANTIRILKKHLASNQRPNGKPDDDFSPEISLLYQLYNEIVDDANTSF